VDSIQDDPIDVLLALPLSDDVSSELQDMIQKHWSSIRTKRTNGNLQSRYNFRLETLDTRTMHSQLQRIFWDQTSRFKINLSYAFILRNTRTGQLRYFHSSNNLSGRYLEEPHLITNEEFLKSIEQKDVLQYAINNRPNSSWTCQLVTNVTCFVNHIHDHPIGSARATLPDYTKNNKAITSLDTRGVRYEDGLCIFRCLALCQRCDVRRLEASAIALYERYNPGADVNQFQGVGLEDLVSVETAFQVNINVFKLTNTK